MIETSFPQRKYPFLPLMFFNLRCLLCRGVLSFCYPLIHCLGFLQRFLRQQAEDGDDPSASWGADLPIPITEGEDLDDEDNLPILDAKQPASAKTRASTLGKKPV